MNMTGRTIRTWAAAGLLATGISTCMALQPMAEAHAQDAKKASVGFYPGALVSLPAFVAQDQGIFERNGLEVELVPIANGPAMTAAVVSGSVTFVNNSWDNLIVAVDKGLPVRGVAGSTVKMPFALIARQGLDLPHAKDGYPAAVDDLVGKNWGVFALGVSIEYIARKFLTDAGHAQTDATFVAVGGPATARPALQNGTIDTYISIEPLPSIVAAKGEGTVLFNLVDNQGPEMFRDLGYNGWWASTDTIETEADTVARFVKSMEDSYCWYSDAANFDKLVVVMQKFAPVPELSAEQYRTMVEKLVPIYGPAVDARTIDSWAALVVEQKTVAKPKTRAEVMAPVAPEQYSCK
jgi:NitT/TauT family transport system substrate-binding protein